jgi:hypothetical protein
MKLTRDIIRNLIEEEVKLLSEAVFGAQSNMTGQEREKESLIAQAQAYQLAMTPEALEKQWAEAEKAGVAPESKNAWIKERKKHLDDAWASVNADATRLSGGQP